MKMGPSAQGVGVFFTCGCKPVALLKSVTAAHFVGRTNQRLLTKGIPGRSVWRPGAPMLPLAAWVAWFLSCTHECGLNLRS
jgi:hypothetical protein